MPSIEPDNILRLAVERASALNDLWNLFLAVATAVIGLLAAGKSFSQQVAQAVPYNRLHGVRSRQPERNHLSR